MWKYFNEHIQIIIWKFIKKSFYPLQYRRDENKMMRFQETQNLTGSYTYSRHMHKILESMEIIF